MASTSSETPSLSSSSSSSSIPGSNYDVFLSFRGEDTRHSFTDHLYEAFRLRGIEAFRDSENLQLGQEIASELIQAIEKSQYAIVVFSKKYADSRWCLDELAEIVECKKNKGLKEVVPVFYHVDPSDVRKQTGPFKKAFDEHQKNDRIDREKIQKWKDAMREVGDLKGQHLLPHQRSEAKCIKDIVEVISNKLRNALSVHTSGLIGIESRAKKLKSHLAIESDDVRIIGIWGTGGMGKTTLARVVYEMVSNEFDACCFIANVREESEKCGLCKLQTTLLEKLVMLKELNLQNVYDGVQMIESRLHNKKILLVLDDVNDLDQLNKLVGERCWFGSGSRIMITTRDKHLLELHEANEIYEVEELNHDDALELFSLKAFKMDRPTEDYGKLSQAFVDYCKGLPLALEVLGSSLYDRSIGEWESKLGRLTKFCDGEILNVLRISFDELQQPDKELDLRNTPIREVPSSIGLLKHLDFLDFGGCSKLDRLPENLGNAESLKELDLGGTAIREVPSSIGLLKHLHSVTLIGCKGLSSNKSRYGLLPFYSMPTSPHPIDLLFSLSMPISPHPIDLPFSSLSLSPASSLTKLHLDDCNLTAIPNDIGSLISLKRLTLSGNDFVCLPESIIRLSNLTSMGLENCTSLRSLPKLPLNIEHVGAGGCISLEMLPDPLKPSDSLEPYLYLHNCFKLADNQSCTDRFISGIKKSLKLYPSLPLSVPKMSYNIVFPGSEIPEWFSHQNMGKEVKIKLPSHLCMNVGIAICVVCPTLDYWLTANGTKISAYPAAAEQVSSDHLQLVYVTPKFFYVESYKLLWEGDVNGFSQIRIKSESSCAKVKWGFHMIYKKDIEDLDMDVLHHNFDSLSVEVEGSSDYNMAGSSGEESSDCEESSEYEGCDWEESSESDLDY